jgi:mannose-6-phosphate isomerase-like protein (cupin superfamily)
MGTREMPAVSVIKEVVMPIETNRAIQQGSADALTEHKLDVLANTWPAEPSRILDWGPLFGYWTITRSTADTGGQYLEIRVVTPPGDGPPLHVHHHAEERYHVLSGELEVRLGKEWKRVSPGEMVTVPAGVPHTLRNSVPVELINVHRPALDFERMFRRMHALVTEQGVGVPPKNLRSAVLLGMLFSAHERENATVQLPQAVMRGLAALGRLLRYRLPD